MKYIMLFFCVLVLFSSCTTAKPQNPDMVADAAPISLGKVTIGFEKFFSSSLGSKEVSVVFDPRSDTVYLQFVYETLTYRQFWDKANRKKFTASIEQYEKDFEARKLIAKSPKSRKTYGAVNGKAEWGQFAFTINSRSYPKLELGYVFKGNNPYFTVMQWEAKDTISGYEDRNSLRITTYFTRTQATQLAALFDQAYILECLEAAGISPVSSQDIMPDVY